MTVRTGIQAALKQRTMLKRCMDLHGVLKRLDVSIISKYLFIKEELFLFLGHSCLGSFHCHFMKLFDLNVLIICYTQLNLIPGLESRVAQWQTKIQPLNFSSTVLNSLIDNIK